MISKFLGTFIFIRAFQTCLLHVWCCGVSGSISTRSLSLCSQGSRRFYATTAGTSCSVCSQLPLEVQRWSFSRGIECHHRRSFAAWSAPRVFPPLKCWRQKKKPSAVLPSSNSQLTILACWEGALRIAAHSLYPLTVGSLWAGLCCCLWWPLSGMSSFWGEFLPRRWRYSLSVTSGGGSWDGSLLSPSWCPTSWQAFEHEVCSRFCNRVPLESGMNWLQGHDKLEDPSLKSPVLDRGCP